jgi:hypothetical protein
MGLFRSTLVLCLLAGMAGCKPKGDVKMLPNEAPTWRAASSFVHCVEAGTSLCVTSEQMLGGWDAFYILSWLSDGSPVSILDGLSTQLRNHTDARLVQARFVEEVERYAQAIRGAECDAVGSMPLAPLIDRTAQRAANRLDSLGLWQGGLDRVVNGLTAEAHDDLDGGELVRLDCRYEPYRLYIASRSVDGRQAVVGMTTLWPPALGGDVPTREQVDKRLHSRSLGLDTASAPLIEGQIDPWLPFGVEEF